MNFIGLPISSKTPLVIALQNIVTHKENGCEKNNGNCSDVCIPLSAISFVSVQTSNAMNMWQIFDDCNGNVLYI